MRLDQVPPQRVVVVSRRQSPQAMQVVGQHYDGINLKRVIAARKSATRLT